MKRQIPKRVREEIGRIVRQKIMAAGIDVQNDTPIYVAIGVLSPGKAYTGAWIFNTEPFGGDMRTKDAIDATNVAIGFTKKAQEYLMKK